MQQDRAEGLKWALAAANQGAPEAQYAYAEMLMSGQDESTADMQTAGVWIKKASDAGYARAQYAVASSYQEGKAVPQDYEEAFRLYSLAAAQGYPDALFREGVMMFNGQGTPADKPAGIAMMDKAARLGVVEAELSLANIYSTGSDVARNDVTALTWYDVAAYQQGRRDPAADAVEDRLKPEDLAKAEANAKTIYGPGPRGH